MKTYQRFIFTYKKEVKTNTNNIVYSLENKFILTAVALEGSYLPTGKMHKPTQQVCFHTTPLTLFTC